MLIATSMETANLTIRIIQAFDLEISVGSVDDLDLWSSGPSSVNKYLESSDWSNKRIDVFQLSPPFG